MNATRRIIIAGGGTGGHVLPALAIADAIKSQLREIPHKIIFVGTEKGIESKLVPPAGYELRFLSVGGLKNLSITTQLKTLMMLPLAFLQSLFYLIQLRPECVIGVGGYASGPILFMAALLRMKTFIWEPNAHPGWTNRLLSRFVETAFIVFEDSRRFIVTRKVILLGMPLRKNIVVRARPDSDQLRVLVFGGSQGARGINRTVSQAVVKALASHQLWIKRIHLVHQTGALDFEAIKVLYDSVSAPVEVHSFLNDMSERYGWADLVFCRSGASTVAEIASTHKAAVFIPFPHAADDHQKKNALALSARDAAILVEQKDFTPEKFQSLVEDFLNGPERIKELESRVAQFHLPNASDVIAKAVLS